MWHDPIVAEVRRNREEYAARFNHDIKAICRAARQNQANASGQVVTLPPKRVVPKINSKSRQTA